MTDTETRIEWLERRVMELETRLLSMESRVPYTQFPMAPMLTPPVPLGRGSWEIVCKTTLSDTTVQTAGTMSPG